MKYTDTRAIIEAGFLTAIVVIIDILTIATPLVGMIGIYLTSVTIAIITLRHGYKWGLLSVVGSFALLTLYIGPILALVEVVAASVGIILGIAYRAEWRPRNIMLSASVTFTLMLMAMIGIIWITTEVNVLAKLDETAMQSVQDAIEIYRQRGMAEDQIKQFEDWTTHQFDSIRIVFASLLYCGAIFNVYIMARITEFIAKRTGTPVARPMDPIETWRVPKEVVLIFILGFIGQYWAQKEGWELIGRISQNVLTVTLLILIVQAISFTWFICELFHLNTVVKVVLLVFIYMIPTIAIAAAVIDLYSPYRKRLLELRDAYSKDE